MKALLFRKSVPRYALLKMLGPRLRRRCIHGLSPLSLCDIPEPKRPTERWVRIEPRLTGICGSDLATVSAKGSPYLAPVTSMPFVLGHELIGTVTETGREVEALDVGQRVVLHPALGCRVRGIDPPCNACRDRRDALCRNVTRGDISSGIQTGYCRDTGGGFGESLVAHESQAYPVPEEIDDRAGVLLEPFACALHGVMRASPGETDTVLVIGCGPIGLLTIAAMRALQCHARIVAVAKYEHQAQHALDLGADELIEARGGARQRYHAWGKVLDAEILESQIGKPTVVGGADVVFDCVASAGTLDDGMRFTRSAGTFVLIGMPGKPSGVDWTPLWFKELTVHAAYAYGPERCAGTERDTFDIAIDLMRTWGPRLSRLVGPPFELSEYRAAFSAALDAGRSGALKTVFTLQSGLS